MKLNSFSKKEHLFGETTVNRLFAEGEAFIAYPFRIVYLFLPLTEDDLPARVMVGVPKKRFKRAVKRNRLKRLMRESYRLNKHTLVNLLKEKNIQMHVSFQYISNDELDFMYIEKKMKKALNELQDKVQAYEKSI